jgi:Domain of unknown function (DUF4185)
MKQTLLTSCLLACLAAPADAAPVAPYPPSPVIRELVWHWDTYTNAALGSDLWPVTWGPDDQLYTSWGDGGGFGGSDHDGRVALGIARLEGPPEHFRGINVNGGLHPEHTASFPKKGKTGGLIFVGDTLYSLVNLQDGPWPDVNHALAWSTDRGASWTFAPWKFTRGTCHFQPAVFLNFGRANAGLPEALAGFVYIYGGKLHPPAGSVAGIYLARVPADHLAEAAAYEFFQRTDTRGQPLWTPAFTNAQPVFVDPQDDGIGSVNYAPALHRFLLASFHGGPGQLGVFDGPTPWGPWTTVCYLEDFGRMGADGEGLVCTFPPKWMSADGRTLWCVFSAYGGSAKTGIVAHDRFNLLQATLRLAPEK